MRSRLQFHFSIFLRIPFNWRNPYGYLVILFGQYVASFGVVNGATGILCYLMGSCWLFSIIVHDITDDLMHLKRTKNSDQSDRIMRERFHSIIRFYLDVKQLTDRFNEIYGIIITTYFSWTRLGIL